MSFTNSYFSGEEESMVTSDNDYNDEMMKNEVKPTKKQKLCKQNKRDVKSNKTMTKRNISYLNNIECLLKNEKIETDIINSITVKQPDCLINVKSPTDDKCTEYWTISHFKIKNIKNVEAKDRWREAECSLKMSITDQTKDLELKNKLSEVIQTIFTRFMSDPKRKITRSKLPNAK